MVLISNLDDLARYKEMIMKIFRDNEDFVDLLIPNPSTEVDIDSQIFGTDTVKEADGTPVYQGQLFPYFYTNGTNEKARTFVLVENEITKIDNKNTNLKHIKILIYVYTEKKLIKLTGKEIVKFIKGKKYQGSIRTDVMSTIVDKLLNKNTSFGLRELKLENARPYKPNESYYGKVLEYSAVAENTGGDICG